MNYFSYDPCGDGFLLWSTAEAAQAAAEEALTLQRDYAAGDGWDVGETEAICYGKVLGHAVMTKAEKREDYTDADGDNPWPYSDDFDVIIDFEIKEVES